MRKLQLVNGTKQCPKCDKWKPISEFNKERRSKLGLQTYCRVCVSKYLKENKPTSAQRRDTDLWSRYRIRTSDFEKLLTAQGHKCAICADTLQIENNYRKIAVDHCHNSSVVRGILCVGCNTSLGVFRDSEEILQRAIDYLRSARMK